MSHGSRIQLAAIALMGGAVALVMLARGIDDRSQHGVVQAAPPATQPIGAAKDYSRNKPRDYSESKGTSKSEPFQPSATPADAARQFDRLILDAGRAAKLEPAVLIGDDAFLRRAFIDLTGRIPTAEQSRRYLAEPSDQRRSNLVKRLLTGEPYAERFLVFFGDILRIRDNQEGGQALRRHVADSLRANKPYDQMVREMLVARGTLSDPAVGFLASDGASTLAMPGIIAQQFMGIRMNCAQCHNHPFDVWTQKEYYDLAAYFGRTTIYTREKPYRATRIGVAERSSVRWPPKPEKDEPVKTLEPRWPFRLLDASAAPSHTKRDSSADSDEKSDIGVLDDIMNATRTPLDNSLSAGMETDAAAKARFDAYDPSRTQLADIVTNPRNRYFAWNMVNRLWAELVGGGIVRPVDDFRSDNPPSNALLLNRLADEFVASGYDLKWIIEAIVSTQAYQRAHATGASAEEKAQRERMFLAAPVRRMTAEAIFDSLVTAGHVRVPKHSPNTNMVKVNFLIQERRLRAGVAGSKTGEAPATQPASEVRRVIPAYSAEEVDTQIASMLAGSDGAGGASGGGGGMMEMMSEDLQQRAARESEMAVINSREENFEIVTRMEARILDVNPQFGNSAIVPAPAPGDHMLRLFGQTSRATLGEQRDPRANTRQTLVLLNGKLVNEAARVGDLEPMAQLMHPSQPETVAIELAYIEALSRPPTAKEVDVARALIKEAGNRKDGIADLRWALLNSLEFRFLP